MNDEQYVIAQMTIDHGMIQDISDQASFATLAEALAAWDAGTAAGRYKSDEGPFTYGNQYAVLLKTEGRYSAPDGAAIPWP